MVSNPLPIALFKDSNTFWDVILDVTVIWTNTLWLADPSKDLDLVRRPVLYSIAVTETCDAEIANTYATALATWFLKTIGLVM